MLIKTNQLTNAKEPNKNLLEKAKLMQKFKKMLIKKKLQMIIKLETNNQDTWMYRYKESKLMIC